MRIAPLALLLVAACASPNPADHVEACNVETAAFVAQNPSRLDPEGAFRLWHQICTDNKTREARRQIGVGVAIVMGAASDAAFTSNIQRGFDGRFRTRSRVAH
jgi:hypothetical protein